MNLDDFSYTENDRRYINPQVSLDEQNAFIDNLRNMQQTDTAQITQDTHNLGTDLPSNLGGLGGGTNYFKSRYQTPQTNSMIADLRATAQANALSTLMNNEISKAKKRYNDAYRAAKKRANNKSGGGGGDSGLDKLPVDETNDKKAGDKFDTKELETLDTASIEAKLNAKKNQLAQMQKKGHGPVANLQWYEKINPIAYIGASNIWAGQYNKLKREIAELEEQLNGQ